MSDYVGAPTPGWAIQANRVVEGNAGTRYDERARLLRARRQSQRVAELARQLAALSRPAGLDLDRCRMTAPTTDTLRARALELGANAAGDL